tara:strand:+ start:280 stop:588 length:309 start_codon:yes stop_codon:yes gene_type:complete
MTEAGERYYTSGVAGSNRRQIFFKVFREKVQLLMFLCILEHRPLLDAGTLVKNGHFRRKIYRERLTFPKKGTIFPIQASSQRLFFPIKRIFLRFSPLRKKVE